VLVIGHAEGVDWIGAISAAFATRSEQAFDRIGETTTFDLKKSIFLGKG